MPRLLLATDGSDCALRAARKLVETAVLFKTPPEVLLLTVHLPVHRFPHMGVVVSEKMLHDFYEEECTEALRAAASVLDASSIRYRAVWRVGAIAETIVEQAAADSSDFIYMGRHGGGALSTLLVGSVVAKVLHLATGPVIIVP